MATKKKKKQRPDWRKTRHKSDLVRTTPAAPTQEILSTAFRFNSEEIKKLEQQIRGLKFAAMIKDQKHAQELVHAHCPHRKPNQMSAFAGQFDHQGTLHLVCAYCQYNVHLSKQYVANVKTRRLSAEGPIAELLRESFGRIGGPEGSPVDLGLAGATYKELQERAVEEKKRAIELCGFDPDDLPIAAIEALILAIEGAQKFMDGEKK